MLICLKYPFFRAMIWYIYSVPTCSELLWWTTSWKLKSCICIPDKTTSFQCKFYKVCKQHFLKQGHGQSFLFFFQKCLDFYINMQNGFNLSFFLIGKRENVFDFWIVVVWNFTRFTRYRQSIMVVSFYVGLLMLKCLHISNNEPHFRWSNICLQNLHAIFLLLSFNLWYWSHTSDFLSEMCKRNRITYVHDWLSQCVS